MVKSVPKKVNNAPLVTKPRSRQSQSTKAAEKVSELRRKDSYDAGSSGMPLKSPKRTAPNVSSNSRRIQQDSGNGFDPQMSLQSFRNTAPSASNSQRIQQDSDDDGPDFASMPLKPTSEPSHANCREDEVEFPENTLNSGQFDIIKKMINGNFCFLFLLQTTTLRFCYRQSHCSP